MFRLMACNARSPDQNDAFYIVTQRVWLDVRLIILTDS
jgi:hypothetical protein